MFSFQHLKDKNINYLNHLTQALLISGKMLYGAIACFIHAVYPDVFQTAASDIARDIIDIVKRT
jgi:hypothetical protein